MDDNEKVVAKFRSKYFKNEKKIRNEKSFSCLTASESVVNCESEEDGREMWLTVVGTSEDSVP